MIDPIIFTIPILGWPVRWYGMLAMTGLLIGAYITEREIKRRGGDPEKFWDALVWLAVAGVVGARLWYVINDILGGGRFFIENPVRILFVNEGGLHIFGAFVVGAVTAYYLFRKSKFDFFLFLDSIAPAMLIGQAIGRIANFINQELYGPPTDLPWGIPISATHRIPPWNDLSLFPEDTTRFHPTFAYEILWNLIGAGLLLWLGRRFAKQLKPGVIFGAWLVWAGIGRFWVEFFRPDQPKIPGTGTSFSQVIFALMALAGVLYIAARYGKIKLPFISTEPKKYKI